MIKQVDINKHKAEFYRDFVISDTISTPLPPDGLKLLLEGKMFDHPPMHHFDQSGYSLTPIEGLYAYHHQLYLVSKLHKFIADRRKWGMSEPNSQYLKSVLLSHITEHFDPKAWKTGGDFSYHSNLKSKILDDLPKNFVVNHSAKFQRLGYSGEALDQILTLAEVIDPAYYRLAHMQTKYGFDISIDYVDENKSFEFFHYEFDSFDGQEVDNGLNQLKELAESIGSERLNEYFESAAQMIWDMRDEWIDLDYISQSKWKTDFFGLEPERFKQTVWNKIS